MRTRALTHVAMSVAVGTLAPRFRADLLDFYSRLFGWRELGDLSTSDRLTIAVGGGAYINIREHERPMVPNAYEHFGVLVDSAEEVHHLRAKVEALGATAGAVEEPVAGHPTFRFRHLLPMAIEVQFFPDADR
jgi:hypothetical protein